MASAEVKELKQLLKYSEKEASITYEHIFFNIKTLPFFTRNPERAKFKDGFRGVLGALSRISMGKEVGYELEVANISSYIEENVEADFEKDSFINLMLQDSLYDTLNSHHFLQYYPLSSNEEQKGEIEIATFLNAMFDLRNFKPWTESLLQSGATNLVEKIVIDSLPQLEEKENKLRSFIVLNEEYFRKIGQRDMQVLLSNKEFFKRNVELFFMYYYFFYVTQYILKMNKKNPSEHPEKMFYVLDSEKITSTRETVKRGYGQVTNERKGLLARQDYLNYLNVLVGNKEEYYFNQEFNSLDEAEERKLAQNLNEFNEFYARLKDKEKNSSDLEDNKEYLFNWLKEDLKPETTTRYNKSIDEIAKTHFIKSRGRLGNTLNLKDDLLILFTVLIVNEEKMLISKVFEEFERRGMFFDRYTRDEITEVYSKMNILEKKSDSGDAQYVKPIL